MQEMKTKATTLLKGALNACREAAKYAGGKVLEAFKSVYAWHRRLMITNPAYPVVILSIGKSLIRLATPSGAIAAAAVALLAALLDVADHPREWGWNDENY